MRNIPRQSYVIERDKRQGVWWFFWTLGAAQTCVVAVVNHLTRETEKWLWPVAQRQEEKKEGTTQEQQTGDGHSDRQAGWWTVKVKSEKKEKFSLKKKKRVRKRENVCSRPIGVTRTCHVRDIKKQARPLLFSLPPLNKMDTGRRKKWDCVSLACRPYSSSSCCRDKQ